MAIGSMQCIHVAALCVHVKIVTRPLDDLFLTLPCPAVNS